MTEPILEIEDLNISFYTRKGEIPAVMDFSMTVMPGIESSANRRDSRSLVWSSVMIIFTVIVFPQTISFNGAAIKEQGALLLSPFPDRM